MSKSPRKVFHQNGHSKPFTLYVVNVTNYSGGNQTNILQENISTNSHKANQAANLF